MIQVENLTKYFGPVLAVDRVSFEVDKGEIVGFLGPNGAGKTTTMRILTTYLPATSGIAKIAGYDVMMQSMEVRANIGYLPESVPLYPEMRVEEYLHYRAKLKGVERSKRSPRIDYCLERCRIREVRRRLMGTLSRGYRQRVGLADAMLHDPQILIMDEPTSGLDPLQIRETLHTIRDLRERHTILLSHHILTEVESVCDRVIIISRGRLTLDKSMKALSSEGTQTLLEVHGPQEAVTQALQAVEGVSSVKVVPLPDGYVACTVRTARNRDVREALAQKVLANKWGLRKLDLGQRTLEEQFFRAVVGDGGTPVGDGDGRPAAATATTEVA